MYFDLIRFLAAVSVLLYHTWDWLFPARPAIWPAHEAVVIFFVLSGYVIAHAASRPGMTLSLYLQHRAARILPVAFLALCLSVLIAPYVGMPGFGELAPAPVNSPAFWWAILANLLFVAQSGGVFLTAPYNTPFWSLNYEVWYYILFAVWLYAPGRRRLPLMILTAVLAGPKILLLLPVWLLGVWLYQHMPAWTTLPACLLFVASLLLAGAMTWLHLSDLLRTWLYTVFPPAWHAHFSTQCLYDLLLGLVVTVHFACVPALGAHMTVPRWVHRSIRYLAGGTFSLYVFHMPLAVLARDVLGVHNPVLFYGFLTLAVALLSHLGERRTHFYRHVIARMASHSLA